MNETLETSEKLAEIYQPNNTIEYVAVMCVIAFALWLLYNYMSRKNSQGSTDNDELKEFLKEEFKEVKESIKEIRKTQIENGQKLARDYERLNEGDKKFQVLFENMNENQKSVSEIKGRLA